MLKFNMGCGHNKVPGYINVDAYAEAQPDEVWDLENTPWPWADSCADEVLFIHSLEHMGARSEVFLAIMKELYRICAPGGTVRIHVPHPRHDQFLNDPTHVRPITVEILQLFDRAENDRIKAAGYSNTPLAHYLGVDFRVEQKTAILAEPYASQFNAGRMSGEEIGGYIMQRNNVIVELQMLLRVHKTAS